MRWCCLFEDCLQFICLWRLELFIYKYYSIFSPFHFLSLPFHSSKHSSVFLCTSLWVVFLLPFVTPCLSPPEPEEKQKEIVNNTIPESKDAGDLCVLCGCQRDDALLCYVITGFVYKLQYVWCYTKWCVHYLVKYVGGYHGLLSGVTVRPGSVEPHSVVECLYACREGLDFGDLETLGSGMKVAFLKHVIILLFSF